MRKTGDANFDARTARATRRWFAIGGGFTAMLAVAVASGQTSQTIATGAACCLPATSVSDTAPANARPGAGAEEMRLGIEEQQRGADDQAILHFQNAEADYRGNGNVEGRIASLTFWAQAAMALGETSTAEATLREALTISKASAGDPHLAALENSLGAVFTFDRQLDVARALLGVALKHADNPKEDRTRASIFNNQGILEAAQAGNDRAAFDADSPSAAKAKDEANKADQTALVDFQQSEQLAVAVGDIVLAAKASANAALSAARALDVSREQRWADLAGKHIASLSDGDIKSSLWINIAQADQLLLDQSSADRKAELLKSANDACLRASAAATAVGDDRAACYALGIRGHLYESQGQIGDAMTLTSEALFIAQKIQLPSALYRWEWQLGRLQRAKGENEQARESFAAAETTVQSIRTDVAKGLDDGTARSSYRDVVGPLYLDLADAYFQKANGESGDALQKDLANARDAMQRLRVAEIDNFFLEPCEKIAGAGGANVIDGADATAAVIYFIPFHDRTEVLLNIGKTAGLQRVTLAVTSAELEKRARDFRRLLETRTTYRYLYEAQSLYSDLIRPILDSKKEALASTQTLVIVADGELLAIPFAALSDGEHFLCEKYAIALAPSSDLIPAGSLGSGRYSLLAASYSEPKTSSSNPTEEFAALDYVGDEVSSLRRLYGAYELPNAQFTVSNFKHEINAKPYQIVHIASHCSLGDDIRSSTILTSDAKGLDAVSLEQCLLPAKYRDQPIELLTLSACETASGDNYRSTLGLAGIGIKCGARSTLATLWSVNDRTCSQVMSDFYTKLRNSDSKGEGHISKAESLRDAQLNLLQDIRYRHPSYWAPYLIIGNWQ